MVIGGDWMFGSLMLLACFLTWFSSQRKNIMLALAGFGVWFSLLFWLFFSTVPPLGFVENWHSVLVWVFLLLAFLPLVLQLDTEITKEFKGRRWKEFGTPPRDQESSTEAYMQEFRKRVRRRKPRW